MAYVLRNGLESRMNYKLRLVFVAAIVTAMAGLGMYVNRDTNTHASVTTSSEQKPTEQVVVEESTEPITEPVVAPKVTQKVQAQTVEPVAAKPSVCDANIGTEIAPGVCQMDAVLFTTFARTVSPEGTKLFNTLLKANNRIYKTSDTSVYMAFCNLPTDLKGANGDLVGEYPETAIEV